VALKQEYISYENGLPVERCIGLSVAEAVELAKAGVQVELAGRVSIDPLPLPPKSIYHPNGEPDLTEMIRQRWRLSRAASSKYHEFESGPQLCALRHGEKVYVFAYSGNAEPEIIVDEAAIYPSDALLARIHLMMQHAK
jgi:hypothetical protein